MRSGEREGEGGKTRRQRGSRRERRKGGDLEIDGLSSEPAQWPAKANDQKRREKSAGLRQRGSIETKHEVETEERKTKEVRWTARIR
jgi:hypothetical protein